MSNFRVCLMGIFSKESYQIGTCPQINSTRTGRENGLHERIRESRWRSGDGNATVAAVAQED